ncbi:MAG: hypothetical protein WC265_08360 [Dysgonamonadaceae bacterium]
MASGFRDYTPQVLAALDRAAERAQTKTAMMMQREVRESMKSLGPRVGGSRPHAAPGAPPAVQTGNLRRSIAWDVVGHGLGTAARVGVPGGTEEGAYGALLELKRNHPFIKPVVKGKSKIARDNLRQELGRL